MREQRRLAAIVAADVVGYSRLMGRDESGTLARLREHRQQRFEPVLARHGGRLVKLTGDGVLAEFGSAVDALAAAIEFQQAMVEANKGAPESRTIVFRIGIHLGDLIVDGDDLYGDGVNVAARLEAQAPPGGIIVSRAVREAVQGRLKANLQALGELTLKNIDRRIRAFGVEWDEADWRPQATPAVMPPEPASPASPTLADPGKPSIAVLAFNNMSNDPEQEYFSDGISEDIITDLSKISELHVVARNSSFVYKKAAVSVPEVAKALGVRYVLEGSVRKAGNRVRVTAQLIDSTSGGHLWASRFDRDLTDIFAVQDELTHEIVVALKLNLTVGEQDRLARSHAANTEAYEFYLRGREQVWSHTRAGNNAARDMASAAIAIDPGYVAAHALIAFTHVIDYANGWSPAPERSLQTALDLAQKAVQMAEAQPEGHFALGLACMWARQLERARAEAERGLYLSPNSVDLHMLLAHVRTFSGEPAGALQSLEASMRLDPHYPEILLQFIAEARFSLGEFGEAVAAIDRRLDRNPKSETAYALLASCYGHLGRPDESRRAWEEALKISPDFSMERRRRVLPFRNPEDFERRVEGLHKAGIAG